MTEQIEPGAHEITWPGHRVATGQPIPGAGTWEVVDHAGCEGHGRLKAMGPDHRAPRCPVCQNAVTWQLTHLAAAVAADHYGVGRLP